jgi:GLPGLI family protein
MKIKILTILLLTVMFSFAQSNVKVTYKAQLKPYKMSEKAVNFLGKEQAEAIQKRTKVRLKKTNEILKDFNFILEANTKESSYFWEEQIRDETVREFDFNMARRLGASGKYYQNKAENISINQFKNIKNKWVREYKKLKDTAWVITKETDTILGYLVIKATKTITLKKSPHPMIPKTTVQVAWFAPSLPMPFGPRGVGGLPGLVLRYGNIYATEIKFLKKPVKIKKLEKGELLDAVEERKRRIGETNKLLED